LTQQSKKSKIPKMKLELVKSTDPILRRRTADVHLDLLRSSYLADLIASMTEISRGFEGIAANQVGINLRLAIVQRVTSDPWILINPVIVSFGESQKTELEGCLNFRWTQRRKRRSKNLILATLDLDGQPNYYDVSGMAARIVQHEVDHLKGKIITDR